ncbi:hypothetical protein OJAV_G00106810 [Oryzias javanicus]|uniref:Uncharacterized protein n=1 Tax=Oryzias javanicus TaxID=123683 RepID=A0A437CTY2_ORYJA|nr:hypothetical protein OJAV_G00106810 [Oryzias javanicus]
MRGGHKPFSWSVLVLRLVVLLEESYLYTFSFSLTTSDALLSVLEFYILMKEEARQPIREAGAGADHRGSDGRGVRGRLGGPPTRHAAQRPRVSRWQVQKTVRGVEGRRDKPGSFPHNDQLRGGRQHPLLCFTSHPTHPSSWRGHLQESSGCRAESAPPGEGSPKWNASPVLPPSERHLLTRCGGTAGVVNQAATVQGPATSQHQGLIAAAHAADLTGSDDVPRNAALVPDALMKMIKRHK